MANPFRQAEQEHGSHTTRNYNQQQADLARITGLVVAAGAAVGMAAGLLSPDDGVLNGWVVPIGGGLVAGTALGLGWHVAISKAERVRKPLGKAAVAGFGLALALATMAASSWAIATALAGQAAQRQYRTEQMAEKRQAFDIARGNLAIEARIIPVVDTAAAELQAMAIIERGDARQPGSTLSGKSPGNGPNAQMLAAAGNGQRLLAAQMQARYDAGPARHLAKGEKALAAMQKSIASDPKAFAEQTGILESIIAQINGFTLTDMASKGGIVEVTVWTSTNGGGQNVVDQVSSGVDKVKQRVIDQAKIIADARRDALQQKEAQVSPFRPLEPREATLRYALDSAIGGFVTALAIDLIPYLLLLLVLLTHDEPLLNAPSRPRERRPDDSDYDNTIEGPWRRPASNAGAQ